MNRPLDCLIKSGNDGLVRGVLPASEGPGSFARRGVLHLAKKG
jgi:hypothetical protein